MKAVILAGGLGTRISEESDSKPKPMIEIGGRPLLWHIMKTFSHYGVTEFIICLGYKGYVIKEFFSNYKLHTSDLEIDIESGETKFLNSKSEPWRVSLVDTGDETMTGGRLRRIRHLLGEDDFFMTYGDGLSNVDLAALTEFHKASGKKATVTAVKPDGRFGVLKLAKDGATVESFREKPDDEVGLINGGFFILNPSVLSEIENDETFWEKEPMLALTLNQELAAYVHKDFWKACDTLRDKRQLEALWDSGERPWAIWEK